MGIGVKIALCTSSTPIDVHMEFYYCELQGSLHSVVYSLLCFVLCYLLSVLTDSPKGVYSDGMASLTREP